MAIDKGELVAALRARIAADLEAITSSQLETQAAAVHDEARAEGDKDMRATETSYLARGLARRVTELEEAAGKLATMSVRRFDDESPIAVTALVTVENDDGQQVRYFLAPAAGGVKLRIGGVEITVTTPDAPLCRALLGRRVDDEVEVTTGRGARQLTIIAVA